MQQYDFFLLKKTYQNFRNEFLFFYARLAFAFVLFSVISGVILNYLSLPAMVQPIHLTLGTIVLTLQFVLLFLTKPEIFK